jgi:hypothetical protein
MHEHEHSGDESRASESAGSGSEGGTGEKGGVRRAMAAPGGEVGEGRRAGKACGPSAVPPGGMVAGVPEDMPLNLEACRCEAALLTSDDDTALPAMAEMLARSSGPPSQEARARAGVAVRSSMSFARGRNNAAPAPPLQPREAAPTLAVMQQQLDSVIETQRRMTAALERIQRDVAALANEGGARRRRGR